MSPRENTNQAEIDKNVDDVLTLSVHRERISLDEHGVYRPDDGEADEDRNLTVNAKDLASTRKKADQEFPEGIAQGFANAAITDPVDPADPMEADARIVVFPPCHRRQAQ